MEQAFADTVVMENGQQVAVVTGATSGIGVTVATRLHRDGFRVLLTGRSEPRGRRVASDIGAGAAFVEADLTAPEGPQFVADTAVERFGGIDVLVNNAAVDHSGDLLTTPVSEIRATFETNTFAAIAMLQAAGRLMAAGHGGAIINITSRLASVGVPTMSIYSASKGSILALTRAAAVELAPYNIRVNAVAPGMTRTPLYRQWLLAQPDPAAQERAVSDAIPLGRIAEPADVAAAVAFLASPAASYLTGISLPVDGGYLAQ
jgi:NAD(P)-dependent dehydrogenase (short-subunit alcohol dehydrogenase family)